ncbi:hypothetical protein AB0M20_21325, partial [Actinoplanes sp. NPDC051633]|uniref:hypothetical protein n=1 Tax=Actinoplanes sp. NPDC051633 TaxID=3155670 RepID=UPI00341B8391
GHHLYLLAIVRISDREQPLYTETLEVTVTIGEDDDSDRILEKRKTTPKPVVTHRTMRPIVPDEDRVARLDDIAFKAEVKNAGGTITGLPLREQVRRLRAWLVFDPALTAPTEWQVEYRPKGLWRPLRERGWDWLKWDDRLPTADGGPTALTRFQVTFVFPGSDQPPSVKEQHGFGTQAEPQRSGGGWAVEWRDERPAGRHYAWDLTQTTGDAG